MKRISLLLDPIIDAGLLFVLVFTPLAFGSVEEWARSIAQAVVWIVLAAWVLKLTWGPRPGHARSGTVLGGRVMTSGLEIPALLFVGLVLIQLIPLPPSLLRVVSPRTAEIYEQSLPGYGVSAEPTFADLPEWLQSDPTAEAAGVPALPPDPQAAAAALPAEVFAVSHPAWRPISLTPAHTKRALTVLLAHLAVFFVAFNQLGERRRVRRYLVALALLAGLLAVVGILQSLTGGDELYWWRASGPNYSFGPFVNANNFAGWMELALPVCVGLAIMVWERERRRSGQSSGLLEKAGRAYAGLILLAFVAVAGITAFVLARSRGGFLALSVALVTTLLLYAVTRRLRWRGLAAVVLIVGLVFAAGAWIARSETGKGSAVLEGVQRDPSLLSRIEFTRGTLRMAAAFPFTGTGLGNFEQAYYLFARGTSDKVLRRAHNDYAQVAAETGILGFALVVWALWVLLARGVVPGIMRRGSEFRWPVRAAAIGVLALLLHSLVDFNLQIYSNGILFAVACAFVLRDRRGRSGGSA